MPPKRAEGPESTALRVALWRAMHVQIDPPPHVLEDEIGLQLAAPKDGWQRRPDMDSRRTSRARASIVARARFIEDLVAEQAGEGVSQYVILGAGLDSFAQRRPHIAAGMTVFEVDQPGPQAWKRERLTALGLGIPEWLRLVPVDFEAGGSWLDGLASAGFDASRPAVVVSTGVAMYLTMEANAALLSQVASLASGSTFALSFMLPLEKIEPEERQGREATQKFAAMAGTPFISFFTPPEILALANEAGFREARHVSAAHLTQSYFADRPDGLRPSSSEELLVAGT